ncbi:MAG TPA: hypothetical protein VEY07_03175 [Thermoplasmata archaeon]|nr:hypothetical protein [Thermoplasmata archaeon]
MRVWRLAEESPMVAYLDETRFPASRSDVWRLLDAHLDDSTISKIHPLIQAQRTIATEGDSRTVQRTIDARGKMLASTWKITYRRPEWSRWEVVASDGPWAPGSYVETQYRDAGEATLLSTKGDLRISVLPFLIPQRGVIRRVMDDVDAEDRAYLAPR